MLLALVLADAVFSGATNAAISELDITSLSESEETALGKYRALVSRRAELQSKYDEAKTSGEDTAGVEAELESVQGEITELDRGELKTVFERERRALGKTTTQALFGELKAAYDNIKAATDAGVPLTLVASMLTYFATVEPIKKDGKTVKYQGSDGMTAKKKTDLMEEWLDTTRHEMYNGSMVAIIDTMRHYMYAIMYPQSKNPFKAK